MAGTTVKPKDLRGYRSVGNHRIANIHGHTIKKNDCQHGPSRMEVQHLLHQTLVLISVKYFIKTTQNSSNTTTLLKIQFIEKFMQTPSNSII